jgi:hypothetical protein
MKRPSVTPHPVVHTLAILLGEEPALAARAGTPRPTRSAPVRRPSRGPRARPTNGRANHPTVVVILIGEPADHACAALARGWADLEVVQPASDRSRARSHRGASR